MIGSNLDPVIRKEMAEAPELWFPGLAPELVKAFGHKPGFHIAASDYGALRWLACDHRAQRDAVFAFSIGGAAVIVEQLPASYRDAFADVRLAEFFTSEDANTLQGAIAIIEATLSLAVTVGCLVRTLHVLEAAPGFDVSFSDPNLPFSVFTSIPGAIEPDSRVRLAESIVHEAMHLQLTLIESHVEMVADSESAAFSPWKGEIRPVQGLLHGLYVFSGLAQALRGWMNRDLSLASYAERRLGEIHREIQSLADLSPTLTHAGGLLSVRARSAVTLDYIVRADSRGTSNG